jgi:hypothetical protein
VRNSKPLCEHLLEYDFVQRKVSPHAYQTGALLLKLLQFPHLISFRPLLLFFPTIWMTGRALIGKGNCAGDAERESAVLMADEVFFGNHSPEIVWGIL